MNNNQQFNNIIPIGQVGYNDIYNQQQRPENNYVFAPAGGTNYANPQYNYYDPYGFKGYNQPQYPNNYGYYDNKTEKYSSKCFSIASELEIRKE